MQPEGAVGFPLGGLHEACCSTDDDFIIHQAPGIKVDILHKPWQQLKNRAAQLAINARTQFASTARTALRNLTELDSMVFHQALKGRTRREKMILTSVATLGQWADDKLSLFQSEHDGCCHLCGACNANLTHIIWHCPALAHIRATTTKAALQLIVESTPAHIFLGIPSALNASLDHQFFQPVPD